MLGKLFAWQLDSGKAQHVHGIFLVADGLGTDKCARKLWMCMPVGIGVVMLRIVSIALSASSAVFEQCKHRIGMTYSVVLVMSLGMCPMVPLALHC